MPAVARQPVDLGALRVIGHVRAGVDQVRVGVRRHVPDKALDHPDRILQRIPARDLQNEPLSRRERTRLEHLGAPLDDPGRAVHVLERREARPTCAQACGDEDGLHGLGLRDFTDRLGGPTRMATGRSEPKFVSNH
jgi:hypothetical protein